MGKKLASNFQNMVAVLFSVTLIVSAAVGFVFSLTATPIEEGKSNKQTEAIKAVIPGSFDNNPSAEVRKVGTASNEVYSYLYSEKAPDSLEIYPAKRNGELIGTAVKSFTNNGFGGQIWVMVGFNPDGTIYNYSVLEHAETPGLGTEMVTWFTKEGKGSIIGRNPNQNSLKVTKDNGEIDAITAATISSRAFLDAVNKAAEALSGGAVDTHSGATEQVN